MARRLAARSLQVGPHLKRRVRIRLDPATALALAPVVQLDVTARALEWLTAAGLLSDDPVIAAARLRLAVLNLRAVIDLRASKGLRAVTVEMRELSTRLCLLMEGDRSSNDRQARYKYAKLLMQTLSERHLPAPGRHVLLIRTLSSLHAGDFVFLVHGGRLHAARVEAVRTTKARLRELEVHGGVRFGHVDRGGAAADDAAGYDGEADAVAVCLWTERTADVSETALSAAHCHLAVGNSAQPLGPTGFAVPAALLRELERTLDTTFVWTVENELQAARHVDLALVELEEGEPATEPM